MEQSRIFLGIVLVWFYVCGFVLLKFPSQFYRVASRGKEPTPSNRKTAKVVGYMGLFFGTLLLVELILGIVKAK